MRACLGRSEDVTQVMQKVWHHPGRKAASPSDSTVLCRHPAVVTGQAALQAKATDWAPASRARLLYLIWWFPSKSFPQLTQRGRGLLDTAGLIYWHLKDDCPNSICLHPRVKWILSSLWLNMAFKTSFQSNYSYIVLGRTVTQAVTQNQTVKMSLPL